MRSIITYLKLETRGIMLIGEVKNMKGHQLLNLLINLLHDFSNIRLQDCDIIFYCAFVDKYKES